jgi:methionyl-tRNA formyltransferase
VTVPAPPWRVVIVTRILPVALGFDAVLREAGHEPVALLTVRAGATRYGPVGDVAALLDGLPSHLDVLIPSARDRLAPLLASVEPDLAVCMGFPWKVTPAALAVPPLGWLNGHPSLLPRRRGPVPVAWAIREGDEEVGVTVHLMEPELDTGPVLAQASLPLGEYVPPDEFYGRMGPLVLEQLGVALERLAAGDEGTPQEGGDYQSFFAPEDAWLDWRRPAVELHRLVWAWRYTFPVGGVEGAVGEVDGELVRVLASSPVEVEGARHVECGDGRLWLVETEPLSEDEVAAARQAGDAAASPAGSSS